MRGAAFPGRIVQRLSGAALVAALLGGGVSTGAAAPDRDPYAGARRALVDELRRQAHQDSRQLRGERRVDRAVLDALARVPRERHVPADQRAHAYANRPLPIGYGQTISQPSIVALMTTLARPRPGQRVLEVGTGSGYQAAVLAEMGADVYSIEIIGPLATQAAQRLRAYPRVRTRVGDGYYGWREHAPYDAIVVTAAAGSIPPPLLAQLRPGGRMVIPVGSSFFTQMLLLVEKDASGRVRTRQVLPVRFVPLTGAH